MELRRSADLDVDFNGFIFTTDDEFLWFECSCFGGIKSVRAHSNLGYGSKFVSLRWDTLEY